MPRSPKPRTIDDHTSSRDDDARRGWVGGWKAQAVGQLPADVPVRVKVQLRKDVERALAHYRLDDDEAEIRDVVAAVVQEAQQGFASELAAQVQKAAKERAILWAPIYLGAALKEHDRRLVSAILRRPGSGSKDLAAQLRRHLMRHLQGNEDVPTIQTMVAAWVARRLAELPSEPKGLSKSVVAAASAAMGAAGGIAYQNPAVKTAINQGVTKGLAKARLLLEQWRASQRPSEPPPEGGSDVVANR